MGHDRIKIGIGGGDEGGVDEGRVDGWMGDTAA